MASRSEQIFIVPMAVRLFTLLLFTVANVALCVELLSSSATCQRPQVIVWPQNLLAREGRSDSGTSDVSLRAVER